MAAEAGRAGTGLCYEGHSTCMTCGDCINRRHPVAIGAQVDQLHAYHHIEEVSWSQSQTQS